MFARTVAKHPAKVAIVFGDHIWSFGQLDEFSNQIANYFTGNGFKAGDEVALLMNNSHEYIGVWLGLIKVGIIPAFINTNNRMDALNDCFNAFKCKAIIYDSYFTEGQSGCRPPLPFNLQTLRKRPIIIFLSIN